MIAVVLVEDHAIVRSGVRALLEKAGDIRILGEAGDGKAGVRLIETLQPDVVVMDIMMPEMNGIQAAEYIQRAKLPGRVVLLSMYSDPALIHQALKSGVKGYVLKSSLSEELLEAIRIAATGQVYLSAAIREIMEQYELTAQTSNAVRDPFDTLSPREKEILQLIAEEYTSSEIAGRLFISEKTVEKHRSSLIQKLGVRNVAGLVRQALKYGLIQLSEN